MLIQLTSYCDPGGQIIVKIMTHQISNVDFYLTMPSTTILFVILISLCVILYMSLRYFANNSIPCEFAHWNNEAKKLMIMDVGYGEVILSFSPRTGILNL